MVPTVAIITVLAVVMFVGLYVLVATGRVTPRLGVGRTIRPLGPFIVLINAPREWVFEAIRAPYSERPPGAFREKVRVIDRHANTVLAAHRTPAHAGLVAVTVETVTFEPPDRVAFELVRGPVPYVVEEFLLHEAGDATELEYRGDLGADLWSVGRWWGGIVAPRWEAAVHASLDGLARAAGERAEAHDRRGGHLGTDPPRSE